MAYKEIDERANDIIIGFATGGVHTGYHLAESAYYSDHAAVSYYLQNLFVETSLVYSLNKAVSLIYPKDAMSFHKMHQSLGAVRGYIARAIVTNPISYLAGAAVISLAQGSGWGLGDYRSRMAEHKHHYSTLTQRKMR